MTATADHPAIKPRHMSMPFEQLDTPYFFDNNALLSAFFAALSSTFPAGEGEFIASVRQYRDKIKSPKLKEEIRGFIGQEGRRWNARDELVTLSEATIKAQINGQKFTVEFENNSSNTFEEFSRSFIDSKSGIKSTEGSSQLQILCRANN